MNRKAFTLVELIVSITILSILGTIGMVSFMSYYASSRDSVRINDVKIIKNGLEFHHVEHNEYPLPTQASTITHNGIPLWHEGTFGVETSLEMGSMIPSIPLDPLSGNPYTYSVVEGSQEYQIGYTLEGFSLLNHTPEFNIVPETLASERTLKTQLTGNYNGKLIKVSSGGVDYVLAVPSIITSGLEFTELTDIIQQKKLAFSGYKNLPSSYSGFVNVSQKKVFDFSSSNPLLFQGDLDSLESQDGRLAFYENMVDQYRNSDLEGEEGFEKYSSVYADRYNPTTDYIDIACLEVEQLLGENYNCIDETPDILSGSLDISPILPNGKTNYVGQWPLGGRFSHYQQSFGTADHARNPMGMSGGLNKSIGIKWKTFAGGEHPTDTLAGYDINADGSENILYVHGGKLFLGDPNTGSIIWETKVLDIKEILGVESILSDGSKSIIIANGSDYYVSLIDGKTGEVSWVSSMASGPIKFVKQGWPRYNYRAIDVNGDGIREYHFKRHYNKYHSYHFFEKNGVAQGETFWSADGYGNYNDNSHDGYQTTTWAMGDVGGSKIIAAKGSHAYSFYEGSPDESLSIPEKFQAPAYSKWYTGGNSGRGWNGGYSYFYDIDNDGNDEFFTLIRTEIKNNKLSRIIAGGLDASNNYSQYFSISHTLESQGDYSYPYAFKNYANFSEPYLLVQGYLPGSSEFQWMYLNPKGATSSEHTLVSEENASFNYELLSDSNIFHPDFLNDSTFKVAGIFNSGEKDYAVLYTQGKYYFYTFTGAETFQSISPLTVTGYFYGKAFFEGLDPIADQNSHTNIILHGLDTDGNGLKEFVVYTNGYFRFYEISDSGVTLVKSFRLPSTSETRIQLGMMEDLQDLYIITYNASKNSIEYYRTFSSSDEYTFVKISDENFYSGGISKRLFISKLGDYNKVMIGGVGMFDARNATPSLEPIKLSTDDFQSYDMDQDGINEVFINDKAYEYHAPGNYTLKYPTQAWAGDITGDGVFDSAYSYCTSTEFYESHLFMKFIDGATGNEIIPAHDYGNGNGHCAAGEKTSNVAYDFDGDGIDEIAVGAAARPTSIFSFTGSMESGFSYTQGNSVRSNGAYTIVSYDVTGDGKDEIIRGHDDFEVYEVDSEDKTQLNLLFKTQNDVVKSTWGLDLGLPSIYRMNGITYFALRGNDGEVALYSWDGNQLIKNFNNYYQETNVYASSEEVLDAGLVPLPTADVLLGDFMGSDTLQVLVGGGDGYLYILSTEGKILRAFNVGSSIERMIIGDTNGDLLLDILVSALDGYVYQIASSRINPPSYVRDGVSSDIVSQTEQNVSSVNFSSVPGASGYMAQLYNFSKKSIVFDWIDIGTQTSTCIYSPDSSSEGCIPADKNFVLTPGNIYQWRIQAYNDDMSSPTAVSNGFYIEK